jgi:hypothetical protein
MAQLEIHEVICYEGYSKIPSVKIYRLKAEIERLKNNNEDSEQKEKELKDYIKSLNT